MADHRREVLAPHDDIRNQSLRFGRLAENPESPRSQLIGKPPRVRHANTCFFCQCRQAAAQGAEQRPPRAMWCPRGMLWSGISETVEDMRTP